MATHRIAFVSDIHGNLPALKAVLEELDARGPFEAIVGGGDYCTGGVYPAECLSLVIERGWECVRGNTDEWLVQVATDGRIPVQNCPPEAAHGPELLETDRWTVERLDGDLIDFLAGLPLEWSGEGPSGQTIAFVHATPWSSHVVVLPDADIETATEMLDRAGTDVLLYGHIHDAYIREVGERTLACIGSAGIPLDGNEQPCFMIAEDDGSGWKLEHVRVPYDREPYLLALSQSGIPGAEGEIEKIRTARRPS